MIEINLSGQRVSVRFPGGEWQMVQREKTRGGKRSNTGHRFVCRHNTGGHNALVVTISQGGKQIYIGSHPDTPAGMKRAIAARDAALIQRGLDPLGEDA